MGKLGDANSNKYCSVPQCKSRCTNEISLFHFPKEFSLRKRWADAIKIEKGITQHMQVCSRHFVKSDFILSDYPGSAKVRRLKKNAVPSQNLPWQFPNKRVSPTLAKARMERLKNRSQQKTGSPVRTETDTAAKKTGLVNEKNKTPKSSPKESETSDTDKFDAVTSLENISVDIQIERDEIYVKEEEEEDGDKAKGDDAQEVKKEDKNMPCAPTRLRNRKGVLKCEFCGRKCLTPQALQTHQQIAHKNTRNNQFNTKKESPVINKNKSSPRPIPVALITVKKPENNSPKLVPKPIVKKNKPAEKSLNESDLVEKVLQEDSDYLGTASDSSDTSAKQDDLKVGKQEQTKTEFECPKCRRRFAVYFMANKHIQKHHSGANGSKMSNHTLKPYRIEICTICNTTLDCNVHLCGGPLKLALGFICTGCEQEYKTLTLFDMHKSSMHSDGVESMFFCSLDEFETWKQRMETQTSVKYSILDQNDTKKIYRCTHRTVLGTSANSRQRVCPSSVVVQEFTKGFQVHYYPNHYGHDFHPYTLSEAFKKYSISSLMNLTANQLPDSDEEVQIDKDLYLQFKKLTDELVNEAARINVSGLKKLMRKALEMIAIVNSYVEDDDDDITTSSSIIKLDPEDDLQDQVKKALLSLKRKPNEKIEETPAKKKKPVFQSTENTLKTPKGNEAVRISNSFTLSNKKEEIENVKCDKGKLGTPKQSPQTNQSPSFLGTFQDFVTGTLEKSTDKKKKPIEKKKAVVKTKMGQFKPSPPKKAHVDSPKKAHVESPKKEQIDSPSPKKTSISPRLSISSVKEIKYEVKEQENDCNILILKI